MTRAQFDTWLRGTWLAEERDGVTVLCVRTTFAKELLETRFRERIEAAIAGVTGRPCALLLQVAAGEPETQAGDVEANTASSSNGRRYPQQAHLRRHSRASEMSGPTLFDELDGADAEDNDAPTPRAIPAPLPERERAQAVVQPRRSTQVTQVAGVGRWDAGIAQSRQAEPSIVASVAATSGADDEDDWDDADRSGSTGGIRGANRGHQVNRVDGGQPVQRQGLRGQRDEASIMNGQVNRDDDDQGIGSSDEPGAIDASSARPPLWNDLATGDADHSAPNMQIAPPRLNPRYTFSTFIVGSGNQLAHAASQAVADTPGRAYNPLFLYGGVGLGKTHLLHAIGHTALARNLIVLYVSSETFTNEIVNAIRYRTTEEFRAKYRSVDVLLVDDIQFIAGKDSTEEEFFHTFNSLYESSKQIVICSDRPPKAIVSLEERLRSRFEWGLIADIQPPDLETRVAILRAKSDVMGRHVPDEVIDYLASRVQSNIRELEGSFNRLLAMTQLQGLPLTLETAKAALNNLASDGHQKRVSIDEILDAVSEYYRIPREDLCGKQRDKHIVVPRQVAMFLMRQETQASLLEIGHALGGRDHSTVLHGCEKIAREVNDNTTLRKEVNAIRQQLLG